MPGRSYRPLAVCPVGDIIHRYSALSMYRRYIVLHEVLSYNNINIVKMPVFHAGKEKNMAEHVLGCTARVRTNRVAVRWHAVFLRLAQALTLLFAVLYLFGDHAAVWYFLMYAPSVAVAYVAYDRGILYNVFCINVSFLLYALRELHTTRLYVLAPLFFMGMICLIRSREYLWNLHYHHQLKRGIMKDVRFTASLLGVRPSKRLVLDVMLRRYSVFAGALIAAVLLIPSFPRHAVEPVPREDGVLMHVQSVLLFRDGVWENLSEEEQLSAMKTLADIETQALGIPKVSGVKAVSLNEKTLADYSYAENIIEIDMEKMKQYGADTAIRTVCHEVRHACQRFWMEQWFLPEDCPIDAKMIRIMKEEIKDYIYPEEDMDAYLNQISEIDAQTHEMRTSLEYRRIIEDLLRP